MVLSSGSYCSGSWVKDRLGYPTAVTSVDAAITGSIQEASALINGLLQQYTTVPFALDSVPQLVQHAAADMAAGFYQHKDIPISEFKQGLGSPDEFYSGWYGVGKAKLQLYIDSTFKTGSMLVILTGSDW